MLRLYLPLSARSLKEIMFLVLTNIHALMPILPQTIVFWYILSFQLALWRTEPTQLRANRFEVLCGKATRAPSPMPR